MNDSIIKRCTKCDKIKPLSEYYPQKDKPSGYRSHCKTCTQIADYRRTHGDNWVYDLQIYWLKQSIRDKLSKLNLKQCAQCNATYPATLEYFYPSKGELFCYCKVCCLKQKRLERLNNPEKARQKDKRYHDLNRLKIKARWQEQRAIDPEKARIRWRKQYAENHQQINQRRREHYRMNWNKLHVKRVSFYAENSEAIREKNRQYYATHPAMKQSLLLSKSRRRARKLELPNTLTSGQWQYALEYFNHRCAICERPRGLWHTITPDHWIPLADKRAGNPGTVARNIIPLCHGVGGCNNSKGEHPPEQWLIERYGKRKTKQLLAKICAYFDSL